MLQNTQNLGSRRFTHELGLSLVEGFSLGINHRAFLALLERRFPAMEDRMKTWIPIFPTYLINSRYHVKDK